MADERFFGNNNNTSDFLRVLLALKSNVMRDLSVAEVCKVTEIKDGAVTCSVLATGHTIITRAFVGAELYLSDIVLVLFTDTDFRTNLEKAKQGKPLQLDTGDGKAPRHDRAYGIIIGVLYSEEAEKKNKEESEEK